MKYVSIDIETTGLDSRLDQILQVAMVVEDTNQRERIETLPYLSLTIRHERLTGSPAALAMNADLLNTPTALTVEPEEAGRQMQQFLCSKFEPGWGKEFPKLVAAGKNFASFDRQFLIGWYPLVAEMFHHRSLDPAMLYLRSDDVVPPSTEECIRRAGLGMPVKRHDALEDARTVIRLLRVRNW